MKFKLKASGKDWMIFGFFSIFLLYLVGYSESQVSTYSKKLTKEFKNLPYGFGAAVGYSMILDEIKTIDDAINEATIEMKKDKEEYK